MDTRSPLTVAGAAKVSNAPSINGAIIPCSLLRPVTGTDAVWKLADSRWGLNKIIRDDTSLAAARPRHIADTQWFIRKQ